MATPSLGYVGLFPPLLAHVGFHSLSWVRRPGVLPGRYLAPDPAAVETPRGCVHIRTGFPVDLTGPLVGIGFRQERGPDRQLFHPSVTYPSGRGGSDRRPSDLPVQILGEVLGARTLRQTGYSNCVCRFARVIPLEGFQSLSVAFRL